MCSSLAAYGIDPTSAVAAENPEDGGVEEEDPEDEDSDDDDDDEDDVKFVFSGQASRLDLRYVVFQEVVRTFMLDQKTSNAD